VPHVFICTDVYAITIHIHSITMYLLSVLYNAVCFISLTVVLAGNLYYTAVCFLGFFKIHIHNQLTAACASLLENFLTVTKFIRRNEVACTAKWHSQLRDHKVCSYCVNVIVLNVHNLTSVFLVCIHLVYNSAAAWINHRRLAAVK